VRADPTWAAFVAVARPHAALRAQFHAARTLPRGMLAFGTTQRSWCLEPANGAPSGYLPTKARLPLSEWANGAKSAGRLSVHLLITGSIRARPARRRDPATLRSANPWRAAATGPACRPAAARGPGSRGSAAPIAARNSPGRSPASTVAPIFQRCTNPAATLKSCTTCSGSPCCESGPPAWPPATRCTTCSLATGGSVSPQRAHDICRGVTR
jgi:hypothetical protein